MKELSLNILDVAKNSVKAGATLIQISLETDECGILTLTIADNGCGMSEETLSRIFEKFYQGDTSHKTRGHGIGLNIVQRIVALARGTIEVESRQGEGSTFTVRLPL